MAQAPPLADEAIRLGVGSPRTVAALIICLLLASAWLIYRSLGDIRDRDRIGQQARDELAAADTVLSTLTNAETGVRGYIITGAPDFLEPYIAARQRLAGDLARLDQTVRSDPVEIAAAARVRSLADAKMAFAAGVVARRQAGPAAAAWAMVQGRHGKHIMDRVRDEVAAIRSRGDLRRHQAQARADAIGHWAWPIGLSSVASLLIGGLVQEWFCARHRTSLHVAARERFSRAFGLTSGMLRDPDGRITFWGRGMEALFGYTAEMAVGQISHTLLATMFPARLADIEASLFACGEWRGELVQRGRDGSTRTVLSHWVLHRDAADGTMSVIEMICDVSESRHVQTHLQLALDAASMGTWIWDLRGKESVVWDGRTKALFGLPPDCDPSYALWQSVVVPDDLPGAMASVSRLRDEADPCERDRVEYRVRRQDGSVRWLEACRIAQFVPDPASPTLRSVQRLIGTIRDISDVKHAAVERERTATLLRTIIETIPGPIYAKDREGRYLLANAAALGLIGKAWPDVAGRTDADVLEDAAQAAAITENDRRILNTAQTEVLEERVGGHNGHTRTWLSTKTPMHAADGSVIGLVGASVEITQRKRDEALRNLMIHELNHRVKNTLATVQALTAETLHGVAPKLAESLNGRLLALAGVHDVLTRESWHSAELGEVVAGALSPFGDLARNRFEVRGPRLLLLPRAAVALAMSLHELATNAMKYGALGAHAGRVAVLWSVSPGADGRVCLTWTETGGPAVTPPKRRGFGSTMIAGPLARDLGGSADIFFEENGVRCVIDMPADEVLVQRNGAALPCVGVM